MVLRFFRSSEPFTLFFLPVAVGIFYVFRLISPEAIDHGTGGPLYVLLEPLITSFPLVDILVGAVLVFTQAILFNGWFNKHEFLERKTNLPSLIYVMFGAGLWSLQGGHAMVFANTFLLVAFGRILTIYRQSNILPIVFDVGFLIGLAALFEPPLIILLPFVWMALSILRPFKWREWAIPLLGMIVPLIYAAVWAWWNSADLTQGFLVKAFSLNWEPIFSNNQNLEWAASGFFGLMLFVAVVLVVKTIPVNIKRTRNLKKVMLLLSFGMVLLYVFSLFGFSMTDKMALLTIPVSFVFTFFYWQLPGWFAELCFWIMSGLLLFGSWLYWSV